MLLQLQRLKKETEKERDKRTVTVLQSLKNHLKD